MRPLAFPDSSRILRVWHVPPPQLFSGRKTFAVSPANYLDWRAQNDVFERMAIYKYRRMNVTGKVKIEVVITPDGRVKSTRVIGGHPLLVQSCQDAVREWKFVVAPEETTQVVEFDFHGSGN